MPIAMAAKRQKPRHLLELARVHKSLGTDPSKFDVAVWGPENRLSCLAVATLTPQAVILNFLEGDPRSDCPLRRKRGSGLVEIGALKP
jgi:hypothetical protein